MITCGGAIVRGKIWRSTSLRDWSGTQEAVRISKIFLFGDRSEGQLAVCRTKRRAHRHEDAAIGDAQSWIAENYDR